MYLEDLSKKNDENKREKISMFVCRHMRYGIYIRLSSPGKNEGDRVAFLHLILEKDKYVLDILFFKAIC